MQSAERPKDKRRLRGEESRRLILQSAISTIAAVGLGSMTLDRVAATAGISRALVVFHFKSKNRLLEEVLDYLGKTYAQGWDALAKDEQASSLEKLLQLIDYDMDFAYQNPKYVSAWHAFWGEAKGSQLYHNLSFPRDEKYAHDIEEQVAAIIEEGGYDSKETEPTTMAINAMLFGVWVESHLNPDPDDCEKYKQSIRILLCKIFPDLCS